VTAVVTPPLSPSYHILPLSHQYVHSFQSTLIPAHDTPTVSSSESISNKVGNVTHGTVGDETLIHQATTLASHSIVYAKVRSLPRIPDPVRPSREGWAVERE
jgi:hypothetical protein